MVELVLLLPLVLTLVFATLAISRFVQVHTDVVAIAHEAARTGALAQSPIDAPGRMRERAAVVAGGLGLNPRQLVLDWDLTQFADDPGQVKVIAAYPVDLTDLPLVGAVVSPMVTAQHVEWVDPFRSGARAQPGPGR
jgi:Flp pilus assembly protein TadG